MPRKNVRKIPGIENEILASHRRSTVYIYSRNGLTVVTRGQKKPRMHEAKKNKICKEVISAGARILME